MAEKIGTQHGLVGFGNWLEQQPGVPDPGPLYNPGNISTWPWDQKFLRTLERVTLDHDEILDRVAALEAATPSPFFP